jgi:predicted GIY-YIG superfamily endonuclease
METWVYQFRSSTELLYVGKSYQLKHRLAEHRRKQPWWPEVTEIRTEQFATEDEARRREKEVWAVERPKYNKLSPLRTREEELRDGREARKRRSQRPGIREYDRKWHREYRLARYRTDVEYRESVRKVSRERQRRRRAGLRKPPWQQEGPGLF